MPYQGRQPGIGVRNRFVYTATGGQTTFSGADSNGKTLAYQDGAYVDVYLNGVMLVPTTDFTATTKTSITLTSGATASDIVEILAYDISSIADTVSKSQGGTFDGSITVNGSFSVDGGTIKLDGNYPVGSNNVALGDGALDSNVSGASNTAIGADALTANTASNNTAVGYQALYTNSGIYGTDNVAVGHQALYSNTSGRNVGVGYQALYSHTGTLFDLNGLNTAVGYQALYSESMGITSSAFGYRALYSQNGTTDNTAVGAAAAQNLTTASSCTIVGAAAGSAITTGSSNTFIGRSSGSTVTTGSKNTILGRYNGNQGGLDIRTSSNYIVLSDGDGNPRQVIDGSGNVGIGTSSPSAFGGANLQVQNSTIASVLWTDGTHTGQLLASASAEVSIGSRSNHPLRFGTNDTERARLTTSGEFLIGTTSNNTNADNGFKFYPGGSAGGAFASFVNAGNGGTNMYVVNANASTTSWNAVAFLKQTTVVGSISCTASSTSYNTSSDYRLKEDVQPMVGSVDRLMALKPVNFAWKVDGSRVDGFLAHEAQEVVPEAVTGQKDQTETVEIKDEDGNVTGTEERPVYQGIDQSKLVPLLTAALQEALTKIEALEARVAALEA